MGGQLQRGDGRMTDIVEVVAQALWRLDYPEDGPFSQVAPNDWNRWPEHGYSASLAQVEHSKDDYRDQAKVAINVIRAFDAATVA